MEYIECLHLKIIGQKKKKIEKFALLLLDNYTFLKHAKQSIKKFF